MDHIISAISQLQASEISALDDIVVFPPPCDCGECQSQHYPTLAQWKGQCVYLQAITDHKAERTLAAYLEVITTSQDCLRRALHFHGEQIVSRWRKRSPSKRHALLQAIKPDIPQSKNFRIEQLLIEKSPELAGESLNYEHCLLPYLNLDQLSDSTTLLQLLATRIASPAEAWAPFDADQMRSSWAAGQFVASFNAGAVVMQGPSYGIYAAQDGDAAHENPQVGYPHGSLIMEAQATLLSFLRRIVESLLGDVEEHDPVPASLTRAIPVNEPGSSASVFSRRNLINGLPLSLDGLLAVVQARKDATSDHLWLLQTEPAYSKRFVRMLQQQESTHGTSWKYFKLFMLKNRILEDAEIFTLWSDLEAEINHVKQCLHISEGQAKVDNKMPENICKAFAALEALVVDGLQARKFFLRFSLMQAPGFGNLLIKNPANGDPFPAYNKEILPKASATEEYRTDKLDWYIRELLNWNSLHENQPYSVTVELLEDHLASSPASERARLDAHLYNRLSEISAYYSCYGLLCCIAPDKAFAQEKTAYSQNNE